MNRKVKRYEALSAAFMVLSTLGAQMASADTVTQCSTLGGKNLKIHTDTFAKIVEVQVEDQIVNPERLYNGGRGGEGSSFEIGGAYFVRHMRNWKQKDRFGNLQPLSCSAIKTETPSEF